MFNDPIIQYLFAVAPTILLLAVMVIGIVLAILHRRQQPWTARLVIPGLGALLSILLDQLPFVFTPAAYHLIDMRTRRQRRNTWRC